MRGSSVSISLDVPATKHFFNAAGFAYLLYNNSASHYHIAYKIQAESNHSTIYFRRMYFMFCPQNQTFRRI
jgi:hypothetical protein